MPDNDPVDPLTNVQSQFAEMMAARERVATPQDRITRLLKRGSQLTAEQSLDDLATAWFAAQRSNTVGSHLAGRPGKSIGEIMNGLKARRIEQAEAEARLEISQEKNDIDRERLLSTQVADQLRMAALERYRKEKLEIDNDRLDLDYEKEDRLVAADKRRAAYEKAMLDVRRREADAKIKRENRLALAGSKPTARELKIRDYLSQFPQMGRDEAIDLVDNNWKMAVDVTTGNRSFVNERTGETKAVGRQTSLSRVDQVEIQSQILRANRVVRDLDSAEALLKHGVGAKAWLKEWQARTLGQEWLPDKAVDLPFIGKIGIGREAVDDAVIRARTRLRLLREELIAALAKSRRVPVSEQERLISLLPKDGIFESAEAARAAFAEVRNKLVSLQREGALLLGAPMPASVAPKDMTDEELLESLGVSGEYRHDAALLEANRRGILPDDKKALLEEAGRRSLIKEKLEPSHRQAEEESMAALEREPPEITIPSEVSRQTGGMINRGTFVAGMSMAGAGVGSIAGPPGAVAGGTMGAMAGSYMFDITENTVRAYTGKRPNPLTTDAMKSFESATGEGLADTVMSGGVPLAGKIAKRGIGRILGTQSKEGREAAALAEKEGIRLGAQHISPRKFVRGLPGTLGVFPFTGTPYREGQKRVVGDINKRGAQLLNELAPSHSIFRLSEGLVNAAAARYAKFNNIASKLYGRFAKLADNLSHPEIVNTDAIKQAVGNIEARQAREAITLKGGKKLTPGGDQLGEWIARLNNLPERITVAQARGLERQLNDILGNIKAGENFDTSRLFEIKGALEQSKLNIDLSQVNPTEAVEVLNAWRSANHFFRNTRKVFETETAKKLGAVDRNLFNSQIFKPGSRSADEMFDTLVNARSVTGLTDLRALVGPGRFKEAARGYLERAFRKSVIKAPEGSVIPELFSAQKFSERLGLGSPEGWAVFKELLHGSTVSVRQWQTFLEAAKIGTDITIRSPSTFVMRRMILGAGLAGGIFIGAGHISIPAAVLLTVAAKRGASFMMNPAHLRDLTRIVNLSVPETVKRGALMRILRELVNDRKDSMEFTMEDGMGDESGHRVMEGASPWQTFLEAAKSGRDITIRSPSTMRTLHRVMEGASP